MENILDPIFEYLKKAGIAAFEQLVLIFLPLLFLAFIQHYVSRQNETMSNRLLGTKLYLILFGWLGTSVHELGHALFAIIFGHRINTIKLFKPDPETGTLGYVSHSYSPRNIYHQAGNFFIGIGPIVLGTLFLALLSYLLFKINLLDGGNRTFKVTSSLTVKEVFVGFKEFLQVALSLINEVFSGEHTSWWKVLLFSYCLFSVGTSISLSMSDVQSSFKGFLIIILIWFLFNLATIWIGDFSSGLTEKLGAVFFVFYTIMLISIMVNLFFLSILTIISVFTVKSSM